MINKRYGEPVEEARYQRLVEVRPSHAKCEPFLPHFRLERTQLAMQPEDSRTKVVELLVIQRGWCPRRKSHQVDVINFDFVHREFARRQQTQTGKPSTRGAG